MIQPIEIRVDPTIDAAYVRYRVGQVANTLEIWENGWVAADVDRSGVVLGIEVLGLDDETLGHARAYATSCDLVFPAAIRRDASA